jgi:hypothetical protein
LMLLETLCDEEWVGIVAKFCRSLKE